jgi:hypothetical protein
MFRNILNRFQEFKMVTFFLEDPVYVTCIRRRLGCADLKRRYAQSINVV